MSETARRVAAGAGWLYSYRWLERLLDFFSIVILARILAPDDFGLVAIAASIVTIIEGLSALDVNRALIQSRDTSRGLYDSAWTLSALRGLAAALIMVSIVPFVTDDRIAAVLYAMALSPLLTGLSNPRFVMFERDLIYSRLAVLTLGGKMVAVVLTVVLAILYRSYWALVIGLLAGNLVSLLLSYALKPYRPRVSIARFSDIFAFSGWLSMTTIMTTLSMETDKLIVGRVLGVADTGLYFMTQRVGVLPSRELISPLQRILFPSFSALAHDEDRLRRAVRESINVMGSLSLPAGCGFVLIANDFVPLVLGDQWIPIVALLTILVPYLGLRATLSMTLPCMMALGKTRLLFWISFLYALVHVPAFVAGTALYGLTGAIWSIVLAGVLYSYLNAWMLKHALGITIREILVQLRRPLVAALVMVGIVLAVAAALPFDLFSESGSWLALSVKILVGTAVFCCLQYALWRLEGRPAGIEHRFHQMLQG